MTTAFSPQGKAILAMDRPYGCTWPQKYATPVLSILRLQQAAIRSNFHYTINDEDLDNICMQSEWALTTYRKHRERFAENSYDRKAIESLWEVSVAVAKLERAACPRPSYEDPAHWLNWHRHEWPCVY
jgi:hypothetical protein